MVYCVAFIILLISFFDFNFLLLFAKLVIICVSIKNCVLILACSNQQEYSCSNKVETVYLDIKPNNVSYKFGTNKKMTKLTVLSNDKFNLVARQNWKKIKYLSVESKNNMPRFPT